MDGRPGTEVQCQDMGRGSESLEQSVSRIAESNTSHADVQNQAETERSAENNDITSVKWLKGELISEGAWSKSKTYLALDTITGELLAIKEVAYSDLAPTTTEDGSVQRMKRNLVPRMIEAIARLNHPNIVRYLGEHLENDIHSILFEYIPGGSLAECIRTYGKLQPSIVSSFVRQILLGLVYLHGEGILHRDLKTTKVLLATDGTCKLNCSFKMEKVENVYAIRAQNVTAIPNIRYESAPEVMQSQGAGYTAKADVWSLGCIVLEALSGNWTFSKENVVSYSNDQGSLPETLPIPDSVDVDLDGSTLAFIYDCWTMDPDARPTAELLLRAPFACISSL